MRTVRLVCEIMSTAAEIRRAARNEVLAWKSGGEYYGQCHESDAPSSRSGFRGPATPTLAARRERLAARCGCSVSSPPTAELEGERRRTPPPPSISYDALAATVRWSATAGALGLRSPAVSPLRSNIRSQRVAAAAADTTAWRRRQSCCHLALPAVVI